MAEGLNKVQLIGNLGQDPELRFTQSNQPVLNCRVATTDSYFHKEQQKRVERTEWHTCIIWGKRAEALSKLLKKGSRLYIEGRLQTRSWDDRDGQKRYTTEVNVEQVILLGTKRNASDPDERTPREDDHAAGGGADDRDDNIPF